MKKSYTLLMLLLMAVFIVPQINAQGIENFEALPDNQDFFVRDGKTFTSNNTNFDVTTFAGAGAGGSNKFLDNFGFTSTNVTYSISTGGPKFTMTSVEYYVSNLANGSLPSTSGSITFKGYEAGIEVFSYTKSDNFPTPTTSAPTYGFIELDFGTTPPTDLSSINIDRLDVTLGGAFQYLSIDNFAFGDEVLQNDPPFVNGITIVGTPISTATTVGYTVIFNEPAFNVDVSDFILDTNGTAGNISNISGSNAIYTVTVSNISGEGTISIDLIAGNNIADSGGNSPSPAFTNGENHLVSRCFPETFEGYVDGAITFTSNGVQFTTSTSNFDVEFFDGGGAISNGETAGSDFMLSNNSNQVTNATYSIFTTGPEEFTVEAIDIYVSSQAGGANPTNDGSITIRGLLNGVQQYTFTKNSGFPTNFTVNNGFTKLDFGTEGASDFSLTNIDQLEISTGGSFTYVGLDNFEHCEPVVSNNPPIVQSISLVGNPEASANTVDFQVTFNEDAFNVSMDDFTLTTNNVSASISNLTGTGNAYTVTVSTITGEGTLRLDLLSGTDIADSDGNTPADPFTTGEVHFVSDCFIETFEALTPGDISWNTSGIPLTTGTSNFSVDEFIDGGGGGSDRFLDNNTNQVINSTYTISITDGQTSNVGSLQVLLSSIIDATLPTDDGTITINGKLNGTTVYTISKTSGFPTSYVVDHGFYLVDFVTEGGVDNSTIDVDQLEITLGGNFRYIALDNLKLCGDTVPPNAICQDLIVQLDVSGISSLTAAQVDNGSNDAESSVTLSIDISTFDCSNIGENTVTLTVTDESGNMATCTATVTVEDNIAPVITCPAPITQVNDGGACGAVVNYTLPTVTDNCLGTEPPLLITGFTTLGDFDGSRFYLSDSLFTGSAGFNDATARGGFLATIDDAAENQFLATALTNVGIATANIGFNDVASEGSFVWQSGSTSTFTNWNPGEPNNAGNEDYTQLINNGMWNDIPDGSSIRYILELPIDGFVQTAGLPSGSEFPVGTTTNTFQYRDAGGNIDTCSFDVTITEIPVVVCQDVGPITLDAEGKASISPSAMDNGSTNNCGSLFLGFETTSFDSMADNTSQDALTGEGPFFVNETQFILSTAGNYTPSISNYAGDGNGTLLLIFTEAPIPNSGIFIGRPGYVGGMSFDASGIFIDGDINGGAGFFILDANTVYYMLISEGVESSNHAATINFDLPIISTENKEFTCADIGFHPQSFYAFDAGGNISSSCDANIIIDGSVREYTAAGWLNGDIPDLGSLVMVNADYDSAVEGDIEACACEVGNNATLTIKAGNYLLTDGDITINTGASLIVEHQGSVVQNKDDAVVTNDGAILVNVDTPTLDVLDFMIMGSPMDSETRESVWASAWNVQNYTPANFNPLAAVTDAYNFADAELDDWNLYVTGALGAGEGFLVRPQDALLGPGGVFSYDYTNGTLNNGVITRPLNFNTEQLDSPNMLSNPYASAIHADVFLAANAEIDALYFWEHNTAPDPSFPGANSPGQNYTMGDVSFYNAVGPMAATTGGAVPTAVISTGQGFGTFANAAGTATFNNSMRTTGPNDTFRTTEIVKDRLWLKITSDTYTIGGNTLVGFLEGATAGFESKYDSQRLATHVSIFSHLDETSDLGLAVQGREVFDAAMTISLGFSSIIEEETSYTISLSDFDGVAWDSNTPYLIDTVTGTTINLTDRSYSFTSEQGVFNNRFSLVFQDASLGAVANALSYVSIYPNPSSDSVTIASPNAIISSIEVRDMRGRVVIARGVSLENTTTINVASLDSAVYLVTINTDTGSITKRLIKE